MLMKKLSMYILKEIGIKISMKLMLAVNINQSIVFPHISEIHFCLIPTQQPESRSNAISQYPMFI